MSKSIKKIAADLSSSTLAAAKRALKEAGLKQTLAPEVMAVLHAAQHARRDLKTPPEGNQQPYKFDARSGPPRKPWRHRHGLPGLCYVYKEVL